MQSSAVAIDKDIAEISPKRGNETIPVVLVVGADAKQMGAIAAVVHEVGQRRLFQPRIAVIEQAFLAADGFGNMLGRHHIAEAQSRAERF